MLQKTVFVITYGRSGSTLLQNMFNALPGYVLRGENNNILSSLVQSWEALRQFSPEQVARMKIAGPLPSGPPGPCRSCRRQCGFRSGPASAEVCRPHM